DKIEELASLIRSSRYLAAFTGAGISTESGIPDFRGPKGIWKRYRPIELSEFISDPAARKEYWRRKIEIYPRIKEASANEGHRALARLHKAGFLQTVITQNIDSLHLNSGIPDSRVIELHGSNAYIACLDCRKRYEWKEVLPYFDEHENCPRCEKCGGWLKPATISFGQAMPVAETKKAFQEAAMADVFLVIGSSLQVYPAAAIPTETVRSGGLVAIINNEPTSQDHIAHIVLHGKAGKILKTLVNKTLMKNYKNSHIKD
ncbi:unnamed protein product, partial [marine sediment metagenome]